MRLLYVLCLLPILTGCAAMIRGTHQAVTFTSEPPGATVSVDQPTTSDRRSCVTPCTLRLSRSVTPCNVTVELTGHEMVSTELIPVEEKVSAALFPVVVFDALLIVPGLIDLASDAFWSFPIGVAAVLPPQGDGAPRVVMSRP